MSAPTGETPYSAIMMRFNRDCEIKLLNLAILKVGAANLLGNLRNYRFFQGDLRYYQERLLRYGSKLQNPDLSVLCR